MISDDLLAAFVFFRYRQLSEPSRSEEEAAATPATLQKKAGAPPRAPPQKKKRSKKGAQGGAYEAANASECHGDGRLEIAISAEEMCLEVAGADEIAISFEATAWAAGAHDDDYDAHNDAYDADDAYRSEVDGGQGMGQGMGQGAAGEVRSEEEASPDLIDLIDLP